MDVSQSASMLAAFLFPKSNRRPVKQLQCAATSPNAVKLAIGYHIICHIVFSILVILKLTVA